MSWKAAAYVRGLTELTIAEKLVLMLLAESNDSIGRSVPDLDELARLALLSEVGLKRCLDDLEHRQLIKRIPGLGRGHATCFVLVAMQNVHRVEELKLRPNVIKITEVPK